ncbi:MAG: type II toxin-antitoxin system HicA family toxin [Planctomycetes bacterium]|nr:type II toxin-antitoxin system HicA family toxin [Planctomycetota bacterium]
MKRRELVGLLRGAGFSPLRTRGPHDVYVRGVLRVAEPRHREIKEHLARKILREAGIE